MNQILARQVLAKYAKTATAPTHSAGLHRIGDPVQRQQANAIRSAINRPARGVAR